MVTEIETDEDDRLLTDDWLLTDDSELVLDLVWLIELDDFVIEIETDEEDRLLTDDSELVLDLVWLTELDDLVTETETLRLDELEEGAPLSKLNKTPLITSSSVV